MSIVPIAPAAAPTNGAAAPQNGHGGGIAPVRERIRPAAAGPQPQASSTGIAAGGWMKRGAVARGVLEHERELQKQRQEERAKQRLMPWRFWLGVGQQADIIILDDDIGPAFFEHNLKNKDTGKFDVWEACPKEWDACPLCEGAAGGKPSVFTMFLSIIDMRPYTNTKTGVTRTFSRKLLAVKPEQQGFFHRLKERHPSLRGIHLLMTRDSDKQASTGMPEFVAQYTEEQILASFHHEEVKNQQGQVVKKANEDCYAVPYDELFPRPSGDALRRKYGGQAPLGSTGYGANGQPTGEDDGWGGYDPNRTALPAAPIQRAAPVAQAPVDDQTRAYDPAEIQAAAAQAAPSAGIQRRSAATDAQTLDDDIPF